MTQSIFDLIEKKAEDSYRSELRAPTRVYVDNVTYGDMLQLLEESASGELVDPERRRGYQQIVYISAFGPLQVFRSKHKFVGHRIISVGSDVDTWLDEEAERILLRGEELD